MKKDTTIMLYVNPVLFVNSFGFYRKFTEMLCDIEL